MMVALENLKAVMRDGWIAKDEDGQWWWYSHQPEIRNEGDTCWRVGNQAGGVVEYGNFKAFQIDDGGIDWRASCQKVGKL